MNKTEKNKVTMYYAVNAVLFNYQHIIDSFPLLATSVISFRYYLNEIMEKAQEIAGTVGSTAEKYKALDDMTELICYISNALNSPGKHNGNENIEGISKMSFSDICRLRENELVQYCTAIHTFAETSADELAQYSITQNQISALGQSINGYHHYANSNDTAFPGDFAPREILSNLFADTDDLLREDIDTMVEFLKKNNINFYNQYHAARTIKNSGGCPRLMVSVTDSINSENDVAMVVA
ncbi:MAG: hypothetical protein GX639_08185 [Fibrobacter sp.]|nr:hypothetical protein [Fibrobacter sp.]